MHGMTVFGVALAALLHCRCRRRLRRCDDWSDAVPRRRPHPGTCVVGAAATSKTEFLLSGVLFLFTRGSAALAAQGCGWAHRWWQMRFAVQRALCHVISCHVSSSLSVSLSLSLCLSLCVCAWPMLVCIRTAAAGDSGSDSGPHLVDFSRRPLNHTHSAQLDSIHSPTATHNKCIYMMVCVASRSFPGAVDEKV